MDARNISTTHAYDALHRLTAKTYTDATPAANCVYDLSSVDSLTLQNPVGRLVKAYTTNTRTVTSYDPLGRVASEWQCAPVNCGTGWWNLSYSYNLLGTMTSYTNGMGVTFTQTINSAGQVTQLSSSLVDGTHPATLASNLSYNPAGAVAQMTYGNGLVETNAYNNRLQPTQIRAYDPGPNTDKLNLTYTFTDANGNSNGNLVTWASNGSQVFNRSYTYDELNRLKTMSSPSDPSGCLGLSWTYDIWANRTDQSVTAGTCGTSHMTINTLNRIADTGYAYDAAGNMTAEPGKTYAYDAENRLTSINSRAVATYVYDAGGRRVQNTSGGTTTTYIYGTGGRVAAEWVHGWTVGYVYLNGQLVAQYSNSTTYFAHADHLGSTRLLTALDKSIYDSMDYLPYGELSAGGSGSTHRFTGKERDVESQLDHYLLRKYYPAEGRWLSPDAIVGDPQNPQNLNRYAYVLNNPLRYKDPLGLDKCEADNIEIPCDWAQQFIRSGLAAPCPNNDCFGVVNQGGRLYRLVPDKVTAHIVDTVTCSVSTDECKETSKIKYKMTFRLEPLSNDTPLPAGARQIFGMVYKQTAGLESGKAIVIFYGVSVAVGACAVFCVPAAEATYEVGTAAYGETGAYAAVFMEENTLEGVLGGTQFVIGFSSPNGATALSSLPGALGAATRWVLDLRAPGWWH